MKFTNLGGATGILEHKGKRILFDPWLDDGIFHGAWYHYPPLRFSIKDLPRFDYIYISHIHEDHCSAGTIKYLNKDSEVILMDRAPNLDPVLNFLKINGFNFKKIHLIKPQTPQQVAPDLTLDMVTADPAHEMNYSIDSGLIVQWDGYTIYNANDCPPYSGGLEYIRNKYGKIDLALLPYAGGSGYPACYLNLSETEKLKEAARIFQAGLDGFITATKYLDPKIVMPFADQYVIAGSRSYLNKFMAHPPSPGAVYSATEKAGEQHRLLLLNSAQSYDLETGIKSPDDEYVNHSEGDRETYIHDHLLEKLYDHEKMQLNPAVSIDRLVTYARGRLWEKQNQQAFFPEYRYYLKIPDKQLIYEIDLSNPNVVRHSPTAPLVQPYLSISANFTLMAFLLLGHISWNIADAALFLDYERVPNVYDPRLFAFVNYMKA